MAEHVEGECPFCERPLLAAALVACLLVGLALQAVLLGLLLL